MGSKRARFAAVGGLALALAALVTLLPGSAPPAAAPAPEPTPAGTAARAAAAQAEAPGGEAGTPAPPAEPRAPEQDPEATLTERLRAVADLDPVAAFRLAEEGERRFPGGRLADERSFLKMRALVHLGLIGAARDEADAFFDRYPESVYGEGAYRLTGVHPRPRPRP